MSKTITINSKRRLVPPFVLLEATVAITSNNEQQILASELQLAEINLVEPIYNSTLGSVEVPINTGTALQVRTESAIAQVETFDAVADDTDSLDGTYFLLYDEDGSVGVWIDTDNSGTTIPAGASAADRALEVTGISTDDSAADVATAIASIINADGKFAASSDGATVTVTHATAGEVTSAEDGDAGITSITVTTEGADTDESDPAGLVVGSSYIVRAIGVPSS
jgi:hypothetical protein